MTYKTFPAWEILEGIRTMWLANFTSKFCKSEELDVPFPYLLEATAMKHGADKWFLASEKLAVFLPRVWFARTQSHSNGPMCQE